MWIVETKDGKFYREEVRDPVTGKKKVRAVKIKKDTPQGRKAAREKLLLKINAEEPVMDGRKLSDVMDAYLAEQSMTVRESTARRNKMALGVILGILGDVQADQLTAGYIRAKLLATGREAGTLNEYLKRLRACLRWAYRNDMISDYSVIEKLTSFPDVSKREKIKDKFLEADELAKLLSGMEIERWRLLTEFLALSGLRIGEAIALDDADVDEKYIHVYKTADSRTGKIGPAKTLSSNRDVFIQPELAGCIARIRSCMRLQSVKCGYRGHTAFFAGLDGKRVRYHAYVKYLRLSSTDALSRAITPHTLRHTHTSLMAAAGVPIETISRRLGHDGSEITRQIYLHITQQMKERDNDAIRNVRLL